MELEEVKKAENVLVVEEIRKAEVYYGIPWRVMREIVSNRKLVKLLAKMTIVDMGGEV